MERVFIGSEALASGLLTRSALRWNCRRVFPDVYTGAKVDLTLRDRTLAAWLWSRRNGVIAGLAASALHGALWVEADTPIEMIYRCGRPPPGIVVRNESLETADVTRVDGIMVTTPERTAFDLARHLPQDVARLDALARATGVATVEALGVANRFLDGRGTVAARDALRLMDGGSRSPHETRLRLLLLKRWPGELPSTEIRVADGDTEHFIAVGYRQPKVGVDYEGKGFHDIMERRGRLGYVERPEFAERITFFAARGWRCIYVINEDSVGSVTARVATAFRERGFVPRGSRY